MTLFPGTVIENDKALQVVIGCKSLAIRDMMLAVSPALADLVEEKRRIGASMNRQGDARSCMPMWFPAFHSRA